VLSGLVLPLFLSYFAYLAFLNDREAHFMKSPQIAPTMADRFVRFFYLSLFALVVVPAVAQEQQDKELAKEYLEQAQLMIEGSLAFDDIREVLVQAANLDTANIKANFEAGHMHLKTIGKDRAVKYFMRIYRQDPDYRFDLEYWIANSYHFGLDFDNALIFYNRYKDKLTKKPTYAGKDKVDMKDVERRILECGWGKEFVANPGSFSISNIGREINSDGYDYGPVISEKEDEIIFTTRRRDGNLNENVDTDNIPFEDIFIAKKNGASWVRASNIGVPVNTKNHDSNLALSPDGKTLFIYKDDNNGDIFVCERNADGSWTAPEPLPGVINSSYREGSITITADGKTLYFASERPGGFGGSDIYVCTQDERGEWSRVKNLGPGINTEVDEEGPFIDYDQKTLYFSSRGRKGMGGHDVFKTTLLNPDRNEWSEPENLGYPINTPDDDVYFVATRDGKRAYFSSVREDGLGYSDIYTILLTPDKKPEPVVAAKEPEATKETPKEEPKAEPVVKKEEPKVLQPLKVVVAVVDAETQKPLEAKVRFQAVKDNTVPGASREDGNYVFTIKTEGVQDYRLSVEREGYVFSNQTISMGGAGAQAITRNFKVQLKKISVGVTGILRNIYFDFGKSTFRTESYGELNKLEAMMKQNESVAVEIAGHTDNVGSKVWNQRLSLNRAKAVRNFLMSKGIDGRRIQTAGFGEDKPLASNDDEEEGRALNRRVEFRITGN
jgi:outer membrane protein OmpA-like peptidoglycan-associated protein/Tol biopolymer transport system component